MRLSVIITILVLCWSCGNDDSRRDKNSAPNYSTLISEIEVEHSNWKNLNIKNYFYQLGYFCFCSPDVFQITVRDSQIETVLMQKISLDEESSTIESWERVEINSHPAIRTIEAVYDHLIGVANSSPSEMSVEFDSDFHFARKANVVANSRLTDTGRTITIEEFKTLD